MTPEESKRVAAVNALTDYAKTLRAQIEEYTRGLTCELERVERAITDLSGGPTVSQASTITTDSEYASMGPQAAVEKFLREHPHRFYRATEIAAHLKARGFTVKTPRLARQQVAIALIRAVKKGVAVRAVRGGGRAFSLKPEGEPDEEAAGLG